MPNKVESEEFATMLASWCARIKAHHEELGRLDSFGGDGDHGATMRRLAQRVEESVAETRDQDLAGLLKAVGWAIMGVDGGATGPLFGSLLTGMAKEAQAGPIDSASAVAGLFEAGLAGVQRRTKAQPGDKTLIDALVPAATAMRAAADSAASIDDVLRAGAKAAREGAEGTKQMQARFGRAKNLGEKSIGEADPGATSMAYLFEGFAEGVTTNA